MSSKIPIPKAKDWVLYVLYIHSSDHWIWYIQQQYVQESSSGTNWTLVSAVYDGSWIPRNTRELPRGCCTAQLPYLDDSIHVPDEQQQQQQQPYDPRIDIIVIMHMYCIAFSLLFNVSRDTSAEGNKILVCGTLYCTTGSWYQRVFILQPSSTTALYYYYCISI